MAIRPPRAAHRQRRTRLVRDLVTIAIVSTVILLFGMRCILSLIGIETWTATWRLIDLPTGPFVTPLERLDAFAQTPVGDLTAATLAVSMVAFIASMIVLGTLANRRD